MPGPRRFRRRYALSAAKPCARCSAVVRTGTAALAGRFVNPAWPARGPSRCIPGTVMDGPDVTSARWRTAVIRWTSWLASSPSSTRLYPPQVVAAAVRAAVPAAGRRHQLAWALQERPELLTGAGAEVTIPAVLRLIDGLCEAGANGVVRPPCPHCGRVIPLVKPRGGVRLCRTCVAKSRAEPCFGCGRVCEAATRDEHGRALCPNCLVRDPANLEVCVNCGRRRVVNTRTVDGPLCPGCPPLPTSVCSICGQQRPCGTSRLTGLAWCPPCQRQ